MFQKWILPFLLGQLFIIATLEAADVCNDVSKPDEKLYCAAGTTCCNNRDGLCCRNGTICCLKIFCCPTYLTDGAITAIIVIGSVFVLVMFCCAKKCIEKCTCKKTKVQLIMINRKHNKWNEPGMRDIRKNKMSQMFAKPYAYNVSTESDISTISKHNMSQMFINPYDYSLLPGEIPYAK